jgi:cob(I)alamin adenosyltransferase
MPAPKSPPPARVTTRTGDKGDTSLFGKDRVRKTDVRVEALGDLDEAQAVIGTARAIAPRSAAARTMLELQRGLYIAMAQVATPRDDLGRLRQLIDASAVAELDGMLEKLKKATRIEGRFVVPGEDRMSATLDHARTVVRRAERRVLACVDAGSVDGTQLLPWLNRLSDVLFVLARSVERTSRPARAARTRRR